jgi:hypothetical protein
MSNAQPPQPKINFASQAIVEDHLKKVLTMTKGKAWKFSDNEKLPKSLHSVFGDFTKKTMSDFKHKQMMGLPPVE